MLPDDSEKRRKQDCTQTVLDSHMQPMERTVPYSDEAFKAAGLEWLIQTDQVSLKFPYFYIRD